MWIFARTLFGLARTGPGMLAGAAAAVWIALSVGEWRGAHSRNGEVGLLRDTVTVLLRDRTQNRAIRRRDAARVAQLETVRSGLEQQYDETLERLDTLAGTDSCNACTIGHPRIRLLNRVPASAGLRRSVD